MLQGHRSLHAERPVDLELRRMSDAAQARPQSDNAAEACGIAQRSAHVGAVCHPGGAAGQRRGAARGSGRGQRQIPGLRVAPEHLIESVGAGAEFRGVRLGVDYSAIGFEMFDQDV